MITINLLPQEFQTVKKQTQQIPVTKAAIIFGAIFVLLTLGFYLDFLMASAKLNKLQEKWKVIQPEYQMLTKLQTEVDGKLKQEKEFMESFVTTQRPLTYLLQWASEFLPDTVWLNEIKMERDGEGGHFLLKGLSIPSSKQSSIEQIESYLHFFKEKMPDANLSLQTTRQQIEGVELTQFISNFDWGKKPAAKP